LSNITRRVVAETALRTINDSLEEQVLERNAELHTRLAELHESERFIRATLDEMSPVLGVIDANRQIIFKNKTWQDIFQKQVANELQGQSYSPYCGVCAEAPECLLRNTFNQAMDAMLEDKQKSYSMECECRAPLLSPEPCWIASRVSRFKGDGPIRLVVTYEDITQRKLAANQVVRTAKNFKAMLRKAELKQQEHSKQIAREVHDQLGATLTMLKLGLATTLTQAELPEPVSAKITGILELANLSLQSVKRVTASLRPSMLDTLGFVAAVNWHAKEFTQMTGIETQVQLPKYIQLSAADSETTFRIIQEALTNVAKHANASKVDIAASKAKRSLHITVTDNGVGLDPHDLSRKNSFGVIGMQERAKHLHGALVLEALETGGTCIRLKMPLVPHSD
jgi:signal transduction histidine kinase